MLIFHTSFTPQTVFVRIYIFLIDIMQTDVLQKLLSSVYLGKVTSYIIFFGDFVIFSCCHARIVYEEAGVFVLLFMIP